MFCPNCGANNSTEQNFCRSCGFNLDDTAKSLLLQIPSAETANLLRHEKAIDNFGKFALGGLGVVGLIAFTAGIWYLVTKFLVNGTNIYAALLLISFIVFALLSLIFVIFNETLKEKKAKIKLPEQNELAQPKTTGRLLEDKPFEPAASVVENSTELLLTKNKTRKFE